MAQSMHDLRCLTFDIDWAPDWAINVCVELCSKACVSATFFATHQSDSLEMLRANPQFEVAIHPNFLPGSSHGEEMKTVIDHCLSFVPEASSIRSHGLVQSTRLFECIADYYPQLSVDASLLLPMHSHLLPFEMPFGSSRRRLTRIPGYWEDDVAAIDTGWCWNRTLPDGEGLQVLTFHPIHVALNTATLNNYEELRRQVGRSNLPTVSEREALPFYHQGEGTRTFLERILGGTPKEKFRKISQLRV